MKKLPWYRRYSELRQTVEERKKLLEIRCKELGIDPQTVLSELSLEIISKAVQESNWQEGLYLDEYRTKELASIVFKELSNEDMFHFDMDNIIETHRQAVIDLQREGASVEEIAAYNLSKAYFMLRKMKIEYFNYKKASYLRVLVKASLLLIRGKNEVIDQKELEEIRELANRLIDIPAKVDLGPDYIQEAVLRARDQLKNNLLSEKALDLPYKRGIKTQGDLFKRLVSDENIKIDSLINPINVNWIHFLHRITLMGIIEPEKCGVFRDVPVYIVGLDLQFAPPSAVPALMEEFCRNLPDLTGLGKEDVIKLSAEVSYKLARIHPYSDGNGRVSRLLMNLILLGDFPIVYLKADNVGRKRYGYSLRRANRLDIEPLAALIAEYLVQVYDRVLDALNSLSLDTNTKIKLENSQ